MPSSALSQSKLRKSPRLAKPKRNGAISLLENALLVPAKRSRVGFLFDEGRNRRLLCMRLWQREALIRLLLDHGADPGTRPLLLFDLNDLRVRLPEDKRPRADARTPFYKIVRSLSEESDEVFWGTVPIMFEKEMESRGKLWRLRSKLTL